MKKYLLGVAGEWNFDGIEHVRNTTVADLISKPFIDLLFGVKYLDEFKSVIKVLVENGNE